MRREDFNSDASGRMSRNHQGAGAMSGASFIPKGTFHLFFISADKPNHNYYENYQY